MIETSLQSEPVMLPGRLIRNIAAYALIAALMLMVSSLSVFLPAVLIHCAISYGRRAAWIALAIASALALLVIGLSPAAVKPMLLFIVTMIASVALPAMLALPMIQRGEAFGRVLMVLLIGSAIGLGVVEVGARAVASFSPYAMYLAEAKSASTELMKRYAASGMPSAAVAFAQRWSDYYSTVLLPAGLLLSSAISFVLSLMMIGRLRAWYEFAARRDITTPGVYLFRNFALPDWVLFAFVAGGLAPLAKGTLQTIAANVLMVTLFLYMLQGFALLRSLLAAVGVGFIGALFAFGVVFITGVGPFLLTVAGLFDPFFDFRHFKKRKDDSHEGHSD